MTLAEMLLLALVLDALVGEPRWLWSRLPHPVRAMGAGIGLAERHLNTGPAGPVRRWRGVLALAALIMAVALIGLGLSLPLFGGVFEVIGAAILLAHRSLVQHVQAVAGALRRGVEAGRQAVGMIVGRQTAQLSPSDVARAAVESAAENHADGVIAPAFWFLIAGLPGILVYKLVNTADSMIGHRSERYRDFGWAAARADDLLNWIPARLTGALICLATLSRQGWECMLADARGHASPNAGWPEAAMAGALGVALGGPRSYDGQQADLPWMNAAGRRHMVASDIDTAVAVLWRVLALTGAAVLVVALLLRLL